MHEQIRNRLLAVLSDTVSRRPRVVLGLAVLGVVAALAITFFGMSIGGWDIPALRFQSDRNDLLSNDIPWNQQFIRWTRKFEGMNDILVVIDVDGSDNRRDPGAPQRARALVDELGPALDASPTIRKAVWGFHPSAVSPRAVRMLDMAQFKSRLTQMRQARPLLASATPDDLLASIVGQLQQSQTQPTDTDETQVIESLAGLRRIVDAVGAVMKTEPAQPIDFATIAEGQTPDDDWQYLESDNKRMMYIRAAPVLDREALSAADQAINAVRDIVREVSAHHPEVEVGVTGVEVVEAEETQVAMMDSTRASVISTVLITVLLIVAFHSWRVPLLAMTALLIAIAWSYGFLTLAIGHLQVLSVVFTVLLLGLGIAYGIHVASCYELLRHNHSDDTQGFMASMRATLQTKGPGIATSAITTAASFAVVYFTKFQGLAEMGLIAAVGIMLCLLAMFTVFPAFLRIYERRHRHVVPMRQRKFHFFEERWIMPFVRRPVITLLALAVISLASAIVGSRVYFDYNLLNLTPRHVDSIEWQQRITREGGNTIWYGVSIVDNLDEARRMTSAYRRLDTVQSLGGVGMLFPHDEVAKLQLMATTRADLEPALTSALTEPSNADVANITPTDPAPNTTDANPPGDLIDRLGAMRVLLTLGASQAPPAIRAQLDDLGASIDRTLAVTRDLDADQRRSRLQRLTREYQHWRQGVAQQIAVALDGAPLTIDDLPAAVRGMYHADDGSYALEIYPQVTGDHADPLDPVFLRKFVTSMKTVDEHVTGASPQFFYSGELIWSSYRNAAVWAFLAVFVLVWFDFGRISDALLSLVPVGVGFVWMFGVMALIGENLNPANIIVLPLMFGIGVDSGVHMLHRVRQDPVGRPLGLTAGTGKGITITSLTTLIGFASMIPSQHRGIQSLGIVLSLGITMNLLACWILMPAWLELRARQREAKGRGPGA